MCHLSEIMNELQGTVTEKYHPLYFPWYLVVVVLITLAVLKSD